MNRAEAIEVLDQLIGAYPKAALEQKTSAAWVDALIESGADFHIAGRAARTWARTNEWFPALAQFLAAVTPGPPAWRPRVEDDPDRAAVHPDVARRITRLWRKALTDVDKRATTAGRGVDGHWHGGPDPCPICRGIRPALKARR